MQVGSSPPQSARSLQLERILRASIAQHGPMPFADFMERALYEPGLGYYRAGPLPWGQGADYVTAPQVHPALGQSIAALAVGLDAALDMPAPFSLLEVGSGNGQLARAVLTTLRDRHPGLWQRLRFVSVERGENAREAQADLPAPAAGLCVVATVPEDAGVGLVYANELLDAFPVHRVRQAGNELLESYVDVADDQLVETWRPPSSRGLLGHLAANAVRLGDGQIGEICLEAERWIGLADSALSAGGILLVDYGHSTSTLYGDSRPHGTLVAQQRFVLSDDLLSCPGDRDLTAHVDFGNVQRVAEDLGMNWAGRCSLRVFLVGMGATADSAAGGVEERLALRHLLVSEIADSHSVAFMYRDLAGERPAFGRERLETG